MICHTITTVSSWGHTEAWPTLTDKGAFSVLAVTSGTDLLILALIYICNTNNETATSHKENAKVQAMEFFHMSDCCCSTEDKRCAKCSKFS